MRLFFTVAILCSSLVVASCRSTSHHHLQPPVTVDRSAEVRQLLDDLMAADNAGDIDRVMGYYTDDAILLPPAGPNFTGRAAIRAHYVEALGTLKLSISATVDELRVAGDWGMVRGQVRGSMVEKASGAAKPLHDRFLGIVDRGADGRWRFSRLMWSPLGTAS